MNQYFLFNCSTLISFKQCGSCESPNSNDTHCFKTLTVLDKEGSGSSTVITRIFHYLEEELSVDKAKRACYWIDGLDNLNYFNKTLVSKYDYIDCDVSCENSECDSEIITMCKKCSNDFHSMFNETALKLKRCYNDLNPPQGYFLNNNAFEKCSDSCIKCSDNPDN